MEDFNNNDRDQLEEVDMLKLGEMCLDICNDNAIKLGDWSDRDVELFIQQFKESNVEPEIDMDRLDPRPYPRSYFANKFSGFEPHVIEAIYQNENTKLEDDRLCPLRIQRDKVGTLFIENPTSVYNGDKKDQNQETEKGTSEAEAEPETTTNSNNQSRARWFTEEDETEDQAQAEGTTEDDRR